MRKITSISHSTSRGLVANLCSNSFNILFFAGFCRTGAGNIAQSNERIKLWRLHYFRNSRLFRENRNKYERRSVITNYELFFELRVTSYELRITNYDLESSRAVGAIWRSECAAEFPKMGERVARKRREERTLSPSGKPIPLRALGGFHYFATS